LVAVPVFEFDLLAGCGLDDSPVVFKPLIDVNYSLNLIVEPSQREIREVAIGEFLDAGNPHRIGDAAVRTVLAKDNGVVGDNVPKLHYLAGVRLDFSCSSFVNLVDRYGIDDFDDTASSVMKSLLLGSPFAPVGWRIPFDPYVGLQFQTAATNDEVADGVADWRKFGTGDEMTVRSYGLIPPFAA